MNDVCICISVQSARLRSVWHIRGNVVDDVDVSVTTVAAGASGFGNIVRERIRLTGHCSRRMILLLLRFRLPVHTRRRCGDYGIGKRMFCTARPRRLP